MSPANARTSNEAIIAAARVLLEAGGPEAVTMRAVADAVGVRPPSLYKRVADRTALLTAVADAVATELSDATTPPADIAEPRGALRQMAIRYRAFAHGAPCAYQLLFGAAGTQPSPSANAQAAAGVLRVCQALVGQAHALAAARSLVAFIHGFVSMEIGGAFRLGGDVDAAFAYGIDTILVGLVGSDGRQAAHD